MTRPVLALALLVAYLGAVFGLRTLLHRRRTGSSGFRGAPAPSGAAFALGLAGSVAAPVLALAGADPALVTTPAAPALVAIALGTALVAWSQAAMGTSWRIGVDARERTALVTRGPFAIVRNPIFTGMLVSAAGFVALLPTVTALVSLALLVVAVELQVRAVEEPYLARAHGRAYLDYAARAGRFVPWLGRLSAPRRTPR